MTIIQQAANRLMRDGWTQGSLEKWYDTPKCIMGALAAEAGISLKSSVYTELWNQFPVELKTLSDVILDEVYDLVDVEDKIPAVSLIVTFNDDRETTLTDVIAVMEEAEIRMGDIGKPVKTVEFEPMPETVPVVEPAAPAVAPAEEPVPA